MRLHDYQRAAVAFAAYPCQGETIGLTYTALGLNGEAGEVAEKVKKIIRDDRGVVTVAKRDEIAKELGDVLWYLANCAEELDLDLADIADINIKKLQSRYDRGVLQGSGDNR